MPRFEWVVLNMEANVEIDLAAIEMLKDLRATLDAHGIVLALSRVKHDLALYLARAGLAQRIGDRHVYPPGPPSSPPSATVATPSAERPRSRTS